MKARHTDIMCFFVIGNLAAGPFSWNRGTIVDWTINKRKNGEKKLGAILHADFG